MLFAYADSPFSTGLNSVLIPRGGASVNAARITPCLECLGFRELSRVIHTYASDFDPRHTQKIFKQQFGTILRRCWSSPHEVHAIDHHNQVVALIVVTHGDRVSVVHE